MTVDILDKDNKPSLFVILRFLKNPLSVMFMTFISLTRKL